VRVLATAARAEAYTKRALGIDDKTAYDLAARGADARQEEVHREVVALRVRRVAPVGFGVGLWLGPVCCGGVVAEQRSFLACPHH